MCFAIGYQSIQHCLHYRAARDFSFSLPHSTLFYCSSRIASLPIRIRSTCLPSLPLWLTIGIRMFNPEHFFNHRCSSLNAFWAQTISIESSPRSPLPPKLGTLRKYCPVRLQLRSRRLAGNRPQRSVHENPVPGALWNNEM